MFRFRFRLVTLFALMSLIALGAAAYGAIYRAQMAEDRAFKEVASKGGWIIRYSNYTYIEFIAAPKQPMLGCGTGVVMIYWPSGTAHDFEDADLELLEKLPITCTLNLSNTNVSSRAAQKFQQRHPNWHVDFMGSRSLR